MQPSDEVGRFEMVNLPSPPADRNRYALRPHENRSHDFELQSTRLPLDNS